MLDREKILIAEDLCSLAWLLCDVLTEGGYEIIGPAATSHLAAELVTDRRVDAALLDVGLADGPSFDLAESLATRGIPFAFMTASDPGDIPLHLRGRPILTKPMKTDAVLDMARTLCRPGPEIPYACGCCLS